MVCASLGNRVNRPSALQFSVIRERFFIRAAHQQFFLRSQPPHVCLAQSNAGFEALKNLTKFLVTLNGFWLA